MTRILHLTHTSVPHDARILRAISALRSLSGVRIHAFGVRLGRVSAGAPSGYELREFPSWFARQRWVARPLRYVLVMVGLNIRYAIQLVRVRPDIVHCHDTMVLPAGVIAKWLGADALIYDAHELESDKAGQGPLLSRATLLVERACWPAVDGLICVSPSIVRWYGDKFSEKPTLCMLNSPQVSAHAADAASALGANLRERVGVPRPAPLFVYVGILEPGRGIEKILEASERGRNDFHVAFVGDGSLRESIERETRRGNVHYCEPVPHDSLVTFIEGADGAFCLIEDVSLSDHFCLPNKLFEYAFAGLPVIASELPDVTEVVKRFNLGVTTQLDPDSIDAGMVACLAMRAPLPTAHLTELSAETQAANLRTFYQPMLERVARS